MDIMGDLALLAPPGGSGMPMGHVVAFNADHALMMDFVVRVAEAIGEGHADAFPFMMLPSEVSPQPHTAAAWSHAQPRMHVSPQASADAEHLCPTTHPPLPVPCGPEQRQRACRDWKASPQEPPLFPVYLPMCLAALRC